MTSRVPSFLIKLSKWTWKIFAIGVITLAIITSFSNALTPFAKQYIPEIEARLSSLIGEPVKINELETGWHWFEPIIKLKDVTFSNGKETNHLKKLIIGFNLIESLWHWQLQPGILYLEDLTLTLHQSGDQWRLGGSDFNENQINQLDYAPILAWILDQNKMVIKNVNLELHLNDKSVIPLRQLNLTVTRWLQHYAIKGSAYLDQTPLTSFQLTTKMKLDPHHLNDSKGELFFAVKRLQLAQWKRVLPELPIQIESGKVNALVWLDWRAGQITQIQSTLTLKKFAWLDKVKNKRENVSHFAANLLFTPTTLGWELAGNQINMQLGKTTWPANELFIQYRKNDKTVDVFIKHLVLESILPVLSDWSKQFARVNSLNLRGVLENLSMTFAPSELRMNGNFKDVNLYFDTHWPLIKKLEGNLSLKNHLLEIDINKGFSNQVLIKKSHLQIPHLGSDQETLFLKTTLEATTQQALTYLNKTPLKEKFSLLKGVKTDGKLQLDLQLEVPFYKERLSLLGNLIFKNNQVSFNQLFKDVHLNDLKGSLYFNEKGVSTSQLTGTLMNDPIKLTVQSLKTPKPSTELTVISNSKIILRAVKAVDDWDIWLKQPQLEGTFHYQTQHHDLSGIIDKLIIKTSLSDQNNQLSSFKVKDMPNLNLELKQLIFNKLNLGQVLIKGHQEDEQWQLESFNLKSPEYVIQGKGTWQQKDNENVTNLEALMQIGDLAKTLTRFKLSPAIDANHGNIKFQGSWPGGFQDFSLQEVKGDLKIELKDGRISDFSQQTEEKLGLGKLFSILSLQTIPRRLKLDFSDLSQKGYSFDEYTGQFKIEHGILFTKQSEIDGPVAYGSMKGTIDLMKEEYHLDLDIVPHVTSSLPIVATIAGGPVAGMATWVASKIINHSMQKLNHYTYKVSGSWKTPAVEQNYIKTQ